MFQWFLLPTSIFLVCRWQYDVLQTQSIKNSTDINITSSDNSAADLAVYFGLALEMVYAIVIPLVLGQLFSGQKKLRNEECFLRFPKYLKTFLFAVASLLSAYLSQISLYNYNNKNAVLLSLLPQCLHWATYLLLRFSAFLLSGSLMESLTMKYYCTKEENIVVETLSCLKDHHQIISNAGPFLLFTMSVDSLLVMLYSFMVYMAWTYSLYFYIVYFMFLDINVIFSLIYICVSCDHYCNALKSLLVPLRYKNKLADKNQKNYLNVKNKYFHLQGCKVQRRYKRSEPCG
jgi:hypothetical protein